MIIARLSGREAFNAAYFFGFFFTLFSIYWVAMVSPPGMIAAVIIVAFYYAIPLAIFNRLHAIRPVYGFVLLPFLWTGLEYFRTLSEFAFPWSDLGYSQAYYLYVLQIVSLISVHGLTFLIVTVNVLIVQIFRKTISPERRITAFFVSLAMVGLVTAYGWVEIPRFPRKGDYKVALLQGSVPLEVKWAKGNADHSYRLHDSLASSLVDDSVNLIVWPETSAPAYLTHNRYAQSIIGNIARRTETHHLVGALGATIDDRGERHYNSCYQFNPQGQIDLRYDKVKLVPFAEHVPYQDKLPFLKPDFLQEYLTFIETYDVEWWSDFYPGDSMMLFELPDAWYSVLICFECTFPEYVRDVIRNGAEFLVGVTNDTWFKRSVGVHMHSRIFITRAVENRCWAVRVANSGLSYVVDSYGRIRMGFDLYEVAAQTAGVRRLDHYSVFTRFGDVAGLFSFLITASLCGIFLMLWVIRKFLPSERS